MAMLQVNPQGSKLAALDPIWDRVRGEAEDIVRREPELASFIYSTVLHHDRLEDSVVHRLAERLDHSALSGDLIRQTFDEALRDDPDLGNAFRVTARRRNFPLSLVQPRRKNACRKAEAKTEQVIQGELHSAFTARSGSVIACILRAC